MTVTKMTLEQVQQHLRNSHAAIGFLGRFTFTIDQHADLDTSDSPRGEDWPTCYITHWFRPTPHAFENSKTVGSGSAEECLAALDRYVENFDVSDIVRPTHPPIPETVL